MAVLSEADRAACWAEFMQLNDEEISISKTDLRTCVNDLDDYMNTNAAAINSAISLPARTALSNAQKAYILNLVVYRRYIAGA